jgi:hypothetical protein
MELSGTAQVKNRYRLLAFHESEKKIFVDKYYPTLKGARIGFKRKFNDMAWSDEVSPMWTVLYQPDQDWIDKMLSIVSNLRLMNMGIDGIDIISKTSNIDRDSLISEIKLCLVNVVGIIALEIEVNDDLRKKSFWDELETELPEKLSEKFKIDIDLQQLNPLTLDKIADAIIETGIFHESNGREEPDEITIYKAVMDMRNDSRLDVQNGMEE